MAFSHPAKALDDPSATITPNQFQDVVETLKNAVDSLPLSPEIKTKLVDSIRMNRRIVGGTPASIAANPWQVALVRAYAPEPLRYQFCGGTIVAPNWILTAAHCVDNSVVNKDPARVDIIAGTTFYEAGGQRVGVKAIVMHPEFNGINLDNDIALLQLDTPLIVGRAARLIGDGAAFADNAKVTVTGWGAIREDGLGSKELLSVSIPIVGNNECNHKSIYNGSITENMFCAGVRDGGLDSCQGDSGGPVISFDGNGKETLVGVVSWGDGCARKLKYGVYTRVAQYALWINSLIRPSLASGAK